MTVVTSPGIDWPRPSAIRHMDSNHNSNPIAIGIASARANLLPMCVLWLMAVSLAVAYYFAPCVADALEPVRQWQEANGVAAAFATQFVFCGMLPAVFLLTVKGIRTDRPLLKAFLQSVWSGCWGVVYLWFYALQARMFGDGHDFPTLLCKMAFDQFVWTPFTAVPLTATFFLWMGSGFSISRTARTCREGYFKRVVLPNLLANWAVWIPAVMAVYAFPRSLQIQMLGLVSCFWSLICLQLGKRAHGGAEGAP